MTGMADDWTSWASECAGRRAAAPTPPTEVSLTFTGLGGRVLDRMRVDVATGDELPAIEHLADVIQLGARRRPAGER